MLRRLRQSTRQVLFLMARRPDLVCGALVLSVLLIIAIKLTCSHAKNMVASAQPPVRFFSNQAPVVDLYLGQLDQVERLRGVAEVSLIFFYAPWCVHSMAARQEVHQVSKKLAKQVQFLAVNCWWSQGKCRKQNRLFQYPVIHLFYKRFGPIEYKGPLTAAYLESFILRVLTPLVYLPSKAILEEFLSYHEPGVVGFFQFNSSPQPPGYITYLSTALQALKSDFRGLVRFGVVTSRAVAETISIMEEDTVYLHRRFNSSLTLSLGQRNVSAAALCRWVFEHGESVLQWLQPPGTKSRLLEQELAKGPALLLFLPHDPLAATPSPALEQVADVAVRYHSCAAEPRGSAGSPLLCCHTVVVGSSGMCELCLQQAASSGGRYCSFPLAATWERCCTACPSAASCSSVVSDYSPQGAYRTCCRPAATPPADERLALSGEAPPPSPASTAPRETDGFAGLQCRTNKTLRFYVLDAALTWPLAMGLGAPSNEEAGAGPFAAIVSLRDEVHYVLKPDPAAGLTRSLEAFIQNFSTPHSPLQRHLVGQEGDGPGGEGEGEARPPPLIKELTTSTFLPSVMDAHTDVLLFYYTQWCGFCTVLNHIIIQLAKLFHGNSAVTIARVNVARNDLPWEFMVDHVPSILLFPKYRKDMSVKFPSNMPITLPNLLRFILKHAGPGHPAGSSATAAESDSRRGPGDDALLRALRDEVQKRHRSRGHLLERLAQLGQDGHRRHLTSDQRAALQRERRGLLGQRREEGRRLVKAARRLRELAGGSSSSLDPLLGESALLGVLLRTLGDQPAGEELGEEGE